MIRNLIEKLQINLYSIRTNIKNVYTEKVER